MPLDPALLALADEAQAALAVARGRLDRLRDRIVRGEVDCGRFLEALAEVEGRLRRLGVLVDVLAAREPAPGVVLADAALGHPDA